MRDFLQQLPQTVQELRDSDELSWLGDSGAAKNVQDGAEHISKSIPDAISAILGVAGDFFGVFLALFTILFICLFLLTDVAKLKRVARQRADAGRGRAVARRVGARDGVRVALGDRRRRDRDHRGDGSRHDRLAARLELRRRRWE